MIADCRSRKKGDPKAKPETANVAEEKAPEGLAFVNYESDSEINVKQWIIDSGASHHYTNDESKLHIGSRQCGGSVSTAGSERLTVSRKGTHTHFGKVKLVPDMGRSLLSIGQMTREKNMDVLIKDDQCTITSNQELIATAYRGSYNLYRFHEMDCKPWAVANVMIAEDHKKGDIGGESSEDSDTNPEPENCEQHNPVRDWYRRLGHLSSSGIRHLVKLGIIPIEDKDLSKPLNCVICMQGKAHIGGYRKRPKRTKVRTSRPGEMVSSDICGPFSIADVNGERYFQTFIDDYIRLTCTFLMKSETQTKTNLERFKAFMDNRGYGIETFRTDQGTEYASRDIQDYLKINGVQHTPTGRAAHAQIHIAKRMNRTLVEMARAMLIDSGNAVRKILQQTCGFKSF